LATRICVFYGSLLTPSFLRSNGRTLFWHYATERIPKLRSSQLLDNKKGLQSLVSCLRGGSVQDFILRTAAAGNSKPILRYFFGFFEL